MKISQPDFIKLFIILIIIAVAGTYYYGQKGNTKIAPKTEDSVETPNKSGLTVFQSDSGNMEESPLALSGYQYGLYLVGLNHSTCVPSAGQCSTYGFQFDDAGSAIKVSSGDATIATIPLKPFLDKLISLSEEKAQDPNGQSEYYTHEDMSLSYQNNKIKLKLYFDEVSVSKEGTAANLENYKALVLFSPR